jgi:hypothetical protein
MRRGVKAHAFAVLLHTFDFAVTASDVQAGGAGDKEINDEERKLDEQGGELHPNDITAVPGGWVKTTTCLNCNCPGPENDQVGQLAEDDQVGQLEEEDETDVMSDDGRSADDDSDYDEYDTKVKSHYVDTVKRYKAHVARMKAISSGSIQLGRRKPRLNRMERELKAAALRGRRPRVERKVAEAVEEREALAAAILAKEEALVSFGEIAQDLITPTNHLPDMGGDMLSEMREARLDYEQRAAWALTSMSLGPVRRVFEDKFNIEGDRIPTIKEYIKKQQKGERDDEVNKAETRVYDPMAYTSTSRMDVDWIRRQRMADEGWIREYVDWAMDTGSTHIVTNDKRLVVDARPTRMTITGVMSKGDRIQAEGGIEGSATDVNGQKINLKLGQTLLHSKANMNLVGANELLRKGNVIHLETDNCYMIVRTRGGG